MSNSLNKQYIKFLSDVFIFSEVNQNALQNLLNTVTEETFIKGKTIFHKDELGDSMYVITSGSVKAHENDYVFATLKTGEWFGEYALIDNKPRSASITTLERTTVLKIERKDFIKLLKADSSFAQGMLDVMIKRHRDLDTIQERLATSKHDLELASAKMKGLIEGAMDAIIMFDQNFKIVLTNPSANKLLENDDVLQRNVLFFFDEKSAELIESLVKSGLKSSSQYISQIVKVIGSNETLSLNEGTINRYGADDEVFYTLILRNIEERLIAEDKISLLTKQTEYLAEEINTLTNNHGIIANHIKMRNVLALVEQVSKTDASVLVTGETGTGKELIARAIHKASSRSDKPLIRINCGAIPTNLIESELFGHKKGAFTGATENRKGRFLLADNGTIFLDEIGELPIELQPKLLRVIQEGEFDPVGSSETIKVDVRIIAATHRNLLDHANKGKFREDLYYRLNVFPIEIPSLRERDDDICLIADEMLKQFSKKLGKQQIKLSEHDKTLLKDYQWPGNVRELQNLIERAMIVSQNGTINWQDIIPSKNNLQPNNQNYPEKILTSEELNNLERDNILKALKQTKWKISGAKGAANLLQIPPTTLASKIKALGIERPI